MCFGYCENWGCRVGRGSGLTQRRLRGVLDFAGEKYYKTGAWCETVTIKEAVRSLVWSWLDTYCSFYLNKNYLSKLLDLLLQKAL